MISRQHAVIQQITENDNKSRKRKLGSEIEWEIIDKNSLNGIFVNDVKVEKKILKNGDVITFGGGGKLPLGTLRQQPHSVFIFTFFSHGIILFYFYLFLSIRIRFD